MTRYSIKKLIKIFFLITIVTIICGYIYFAFRDYIQGPSIVVTEPINGVTINKPTTRVKGQVQRVKDISLNGRPLLIDEEGNFDEDLLLFPGYNVALLTAIDKFGRTIEYKLELVYED